MNVSNAAPMRRSWWETWSVVVVVVVLVADGDGDGSLVG